MNRKDKQYRGRGGSGEEKIEKFIRGEELGG